MKTMLIISVILELIMVAFYMFSPLLSGGAKRLAAKTSCAVMFVIIGIFAALASGGYSTYAVLITIGAAFGAFGDYSLSLDVKNRRFVIGVGSFLIGHIFYTAAFIFMLTEISALTPLKIGLLVAAVFAISLIIVIIGIKLKVSPGEGLVPVLAYILIIITMFVFSVALAVSVSQNDGIAGTGAAICIVSGSLLFIASDAILALEAFTNGAYKISRHANPITYFSAQVLIGLSIYFIQLSTG